MRDLTTIQLDEIRNGGWAKVERFEQAEALMKAINRREVSTTKRAIARQAIYPDTGWIVRYGDLRSRSQLLSVAQKIRRDHIADAAGLGLDALIGLLYSTSVPWDYTSYTDRMDIWTERLAYTAPEVANDRDKYLKAWETVEPLIRGSVESVDEHPDVVRGYLAPQSTETATCCCCPPDENVSAARSSEWESTPLDEMDPYLSSLHRTETAPSDESIFAAQNEGIAQVRAEVEAKENAQPISIDEVVNKVEHRRGELAIARDWRGWLSEGEAEELDALTRWLDRAEQASRTGGFEEPGGAIREAVGIPLGAPIYIGADSTVVEAGPELTSFGDFLNIDVPHGGHVHKMERVIELAMDAAEESFVKLVGQLAGSLLPWEPGQGPVEGTAANAKLQDFISELANQLTEDARVIFLGYVNAAATAAQLEREDALPDVTGVSEDDYLPGGCLS